MQRNRLVVVLVLTLGAQAIAVGAMGLPFGVAGTNRAPGAWSQEQGPGRGDDLDRIKAWRAFLTRADRAFFAGRMNTEQVRAKIAEADERIEELEAAAKPDPGGRSDITGDVAFLERAFRAFTAARMNTADVQKWLEEAKEK